MGIIHIYSGCNTPDEDATMSIEKMMNRKFIITNVFFAKGHTVVTSERRSSR